MELIYRVLVLIIIKILSFHPIPKISGDSGDSLANMVIMKCSASQESGNELSKFGSDSELI